MNDSNGCNKTALIQGDFHLSNKDAKCLLENNLDEWDTLLVEGRDSVYNFEESKFGFRYYAIGSIFFELIPLSLHKIADIIGIAKEDPVDEAKIDTNKRIDATHNEIWAFTPAFLRYSLILLATVASLLILFESNNYINTHSIPELYCYLLFYPGLPVLVSLLTLLNPTNSRKRNHAMVENIVSYTKENNHDNVLILVGEMHREGIIKELEKENWNVESEETRSKIGKYLSSVYRLFGDWK